MFRGAQSCSSILSAGCSVNVVSKSSSRLSIRRSLLPRPVQSTRKEFLSSAARSNAEVGNANVDKSEGDVNLSSLRGDWQASHISSETRSILDEDSKYFLHQTLSTPCLNALQKVDGIWLEDTQGRRYMDFHGNSVHQVGFSNKYVLDAIKQQLDSLSFCTRRYTNQTSIDLARRLVEEARAATNHMMPTDARPDSPLSRVLFTPGGTAAVGIALKLARLATGRFKTISMWDSFHGASLDSISVGGEAAFRRGIGPLLPGTEHVPPPDEYRCLFGCQSTGCSMKCADFIEYVLEKEGDVAAVIAEPIRWLPYIPPKEYWQRVRKACNKHGALLIFDEIPNSLGRTGVGLFSFQMFDVVPDIVVVGKGLGGGVLPIAAVLAREHLNEYSKLAALGHYTHEKNPVLCASGLATLNYIRDHNLIENARVLGLHGLKRMKALQQKYELVGDVRGQGLLMGIELVTNRVTKERAAKEAETILYECLSRGLSFKLTMQSIITLCPPLTITQEELDKAFDIVDECIGLVSKK